MIEITKNMIQFVLLKGIFKLIFGRVFPEKQIKYEHFLINFKFVSK